MTVRSGQSVTILFATNGSVTPDALPVGTLYKNGTVNGASVTVTNISGTLYKVAVTLPTLAAADIVSLAMTYAVATVAHAEVPWEDSADIALDANGYITVANGGIDAPAFSTLLRIHTLPYCQVYFPTLGALVNDTYLLAGTYGQFDVDSTRHQLCPYFASVNLGTQQFLWYDESNNVWTISAAVGTQGSAYWTQVTTPNGTVGPGMPSPNGVYNPHGTAGHSPVVTFRNQQELIYPWMGTESSIYLDNIANAVVGTTAFKGPSAQVNGTVTGTPTTTSFIDTNLASLTSNVDNFNGRTLYFLVTGGGGLLAYQATVITGYDPSTQTLRFSPVTQAPANGDAYLIS